MDNSEMRGRIGFGVANVILAVAVAFGALRLLPDRWWLVDGGAILLTALYAGSGVSLLTNRSFGRRITQVAAGVGLALGLALFAALVITAFWLKGVYAQTGATGSIVFGLVALLVLPYLVVLPAIELVWIGKRP